MRGKDQLPPKLQEAVSQGLLKRIPLTFLPFVNQQLTQWENLFPNERQSVERLLSFIMGLSPEQSADLFRTVVDLEEKMGVRKWQFSTDEQTIQNSSQLASSPYFQEWRRAVQAVFDAADQHARRTEGARPKNQNRLLLLDMPQRLSFDSATTWRRWEGIGHPLSIDFSQSGSELGSFETLIAGKLGSGGKRIGGLLSAARNRPHGSPADTWVIDAGLGLVDSVLKGEPSSAIPSDAIVLGYDRLDRYRESFSREMNSMRKDLADADAVFDRLRKVDVIPWCPPEIQAAPATREFVRSLYLSGNGAVIFGNSFVQWASSEAFRRARPTFLAAQFGVRSKPKPFTGVAVFNNPDRVNPLPTVDDLQGSAADAQMLSLYVWLAANRFEEFQHGTVCLCFAESLSQAYLIAPADFQLEFESGPIPMERLSSILGEWIA